MMDPFEKSKEPKRKRRYFCKVELKVTHMNIAIIGYGKMGKMIESIALEKGHTIGSRIDIDNQELLEPDNLAGHDAAIEFTRPETAVNNITRCLEAGIPVVSGTTGWTDRLDEMMEICRKKDGTLLYASNFSLGVNIFFHLNRKLASIMESQAVYDVRLKEIHHTRKLDAPSGTAITLAGDILSRIRRKTKWILSGSETRSDDDRRELFIEAIREGDVPGIHEISYESEFDEISLRHSAKDRRGFAMGAVMAAEYIHDKKGIFTMQDILNL
jgi:4-hydroxy-tetrahydrodipicolinate reductase